MLDCKWWVFTIHKDTPAGRLLFLQCQFQILDIIGIAQMIGADACAAEHGKVGACVERQP